MCVCVWGYTSILIYTHSVYVCVCVCVCTRTRVCGHYSRGVLVFRGVYRGQRMVLLTHLASSTRATMPAARGADAEVPVCDWVQRSWMSTVTWKQRQSQNSPQSFLTRKQCQSQNSPQSFLTHTKKEEINMKRTQDQHFHTHTPPHGGWETACIRHTQNSADGTTCYWLISTFRNMCMLMCRCAFSFPL